MNFFMPIFGISSFQKGAVIGFCAEDSNFHPLTSSILCFNGLVSLILIEIKFTKVHDERDRC
jgi:hypothetical protein